MNQTPLADFWSLTPDQREAVLRAGIVETHAWHFARNRAYQQTVSARGVGPVLQADALARVLRPTSQTFKSYIDLLGTPFPNDRPQEFLGWLADQLSIELPRARFSRFRPRYGSLEALLRAIETIFADLGLVAAEIAGHAIGAAQVAAIGHRQPQISDAAGELVDERRVAGHFA